jgi:solute carrier family 39 (zinc transporter), member 9
MSGLFTLLALGVVMATASFLAGVLPLALTLSSKQLRLISTIGMGVLVGTSLIVIIPEGVETLYSANTESHGHVSRSVHSRNNDVRWARDTSALVSRAELPDADAFSMPGPVVPNAANVPPPTPTEPGVIGILGAEDQEKENSHEGETTEKGHDESHHAWIGVALITGFILMFLIDKLPEYSSPSKPKQQTHHISLNNLGRRFNMTRSLDGDEEAESFIEGGSSPVQQNRSFATTTGLVIHAAADGIALGASSSTSNTSLSFIIFFAIMVHKAPAAFGLTSVLLKQGVSKRTARAHLLLFSLAAPLGAILTWIFAHSIGAGKVGSDGNTTWWTGMLLLFSAGTFLYVAMHSMQEITKPPKDNQANGHANGFVDGREAPRVEEKPPITDLLVACFGMILPLFLQVGHAH